MEQTLKVTNVLSDPTRFNIYEYIVKHHDAVSVVDIANEFKIHPNVARLHLSKLEDINMVISFSQKTGKGGRPSRLYQLSDEVIELNFPHRDYKLLSSIAIESFVELGEAGRKALYKTGKKYGNQVIDNYQTLNTAQQPSIIQKLHILEDAGNMLGMYPNFEYNEVDNSVSFSIKNCPFKEIAIKNENQTMICNMHQSFLKGMFEALFTDVELIEEENMFQGCENCSYVAKLSAVN
ncbi:helix-turn-helix transcriptional regulator [Oceanobacillus halotolerans]|uniref:helix-turn-helix transcriptional regulator n=1 Tax=Oceanobacillus halotolerans TaxID=2663380 RepID=UPI0013DA2611|nr:helix-turn-helix domain-containing protein [Oceanobacillus halotolerans]